MKKNWLWLVLLLFCLSGCSGVTGGAAATPIDIDIREKMFIAQVNDVFLNTQENLGKIIRIQGIFTSCSDGAGNTYRSVLRYGPGCCGNDGEIGFEVIWDDPTHAYPNPGDWVEAVGALEVYEEYGASYLRLRLSSLQTLDVRGAETVTQ